VPVRAVLFDVDDTLVDHRSAQRAGLAALLAADGLDADEAAQARWGELVDATFARYLAGELSFVEQRRVRIRAMTGRELDDGEADSWVARNVAGFEAALTVFDDVLPTLDRLRAVPGLRLGAFSNVDGDFTRRKLGLVGVLDRFDVVLGVEEVGAPKPAPEPFWALCRALGVEPSEAVHVGDRWSVDAASARAAGLTGVWLDRPGAYGGARRPPLGAPDVADIPVVRSLVDLADLVCGTNVLGAVGDDHRSQPL
jgi:putative hydrolase of the HAD superfamily